MNVNLINFSKPETGSFLVDIVLWLVQISSSVTLGVILFTVLLKLVTLPFDFMSRASMRKNSLKMEQMRPELEKLQKQYADNKELYNQKMMALYKKNGYSMFGACLPTIITLVIFIVALNGFSKYSQFQNRQYFYNMSQSYNNVVYAGMELDDNYIVRDEEGKLIVDAKTLYEKYIANEDGVDGTEEITANNHKILLSVETKTEGEFFTIKTNGGYVKYSRNIKEDKTLGDFASYSVMLDSVKAGNLKSEENNQFKIYKGEDQNGQEIWQDFATAYAEAKAQNNALTEEEYFSTFIKDICSEKAAECFRTENEQFLWVKNIWVTDSPTKHPVESSWETFRSTHGYPSDGFDIGEDGYNALIGKLEFEKSAPNGYFILVALTAGMSLLMQIVMGKSQKAQMELQTVNGQGMQTQKIMKWMMPIMMAIFAFMYTAAFSIYIILSNILSIATTFGINFIVDRRFKKKEGIVESGVIHGRVYTPKEEPAPAKPEKKKNKNQPPENDFLSGVADKKKHVRGRMK